MISSSFSLVPVNHWAAAVDYAILQSGGKSLRSKDYLARYFFSYLRKSGMVDNDIYRTLGRTKEPRKGNAYITKMSDKSEYRHAIHVAIQSNGLEIMAPLVESDVIKMMFPSILNRYFSKLNNKAVMTYKRDNKIENKKEFGKKTYKKQILYICLIELVSTCTANCYEQAFDFVDKAAHMFDLDLSEQELLIDRWFKAAGYSNYSNPYDSSMVSLYGLYGYELQRLIEIKDYVVYELNHGSNA